MEDNARREFHDGEPMITPLLSKGIKGVDERLMGFIWSWAELANDVTRVQLEVISL